MKAHELFVELASENRLAILKALEKEPLKFTMITKMIDATSPEVSRQLNRLSGNDLITKDGEGYYSLTYLGMLVLSSLPVLEVIARRSDFFQDHDTSPIPSQLIRQLDHLAGTESVEGVFVLVNRMMALFEEVHEYGWYLSDDFPRFYVPGIKKKLQEGVKFRAIYPESFVGTLREELPEKIFEYTEIRTMEEVRMVINVSDSFGLLALPGKDGKIDRDHVLLSSDGEFIAWCREVFEHYWKISERC